MGMGKESMVQDTPPGRDSRSCSAGLVRQNLSADTA